MSGALPWLGFAAGLAVIAVTLNSVLTTMVMLRSASSTITSIVAKAARRGLVAPPSGLP